LTDDGEFQRRRSSRWGTSRRRGIAAQSHYTHPLNQRIWDCPSSYQLEQSIA